MVRPKYIVVRATEEKTIERIQAIKYVCGFRSYEDVVKFLLWNYEQSYALGL